MNPFPFNVIIFPTVDPDEGVSGVELRPNNVSRYIFGYA